MENRAETSGSLNNNIALTVLAVGIVVIAVRGLGHGINGSHELGITGTILLYFMVGRWFRYIQDNTNSEK